MALAPLLYNITFDSQTRILYFWDKAGHEIYHCEIPSPAPALPTVEMINSRIGTLDSVGKISSWSNGDSAYQWRSIGGVYSLYTTENTSYIVCCGRINNTTASNAVFYGFDAEFDLQGHIKITNNTGSAYSNAYSSLSYVCKNSSATVITVYDSNNSPYNAFQYTSDGTDYYYVLDGVQTDWTDDLSSIGYKLPTIGYLSSVKTAMSMNAGALETLYDENGTKMTVSTYGISYPAVRVYSSSSDTTGTAVVNNNWTVHGPQFYSGDLSVSNLTGSRQTIQRIAFIK